MLLITLINRLSFTRKLPGLALITLLLSGCVGTKQFKEGKYVLYKQKTVAPKSVNKEDLRQQLVQKKNRRLFGLPIFYYAAIYNQGLRNYDSAKYEAKKREIEKKYEAKIEKHVGKQRKINRLTTRRDNKLAKQDNILRNGNMFMRWGEPLVYFDSTQTALSVQNIDSYLISKGWFNASSGYTVRYFQKRAYVSYLSKPGTPYKIDSVYYSIKDPRIDSLVSSREDKILAKNQQYDQAKLVQERNSIETLLKNNGHFSFSKQYIRYEVDTTMGNHKVAVKMSIPLPPGETAHPYYVIDSVIFTTDASIQNSLNRKRITFPYEGVTYRYFDRQYSKKVLNRRIFVKPGLLYSKESTISTQRELANMDIFQFVNISYDTTGGKFITNIFTSPLSKYQFSSETGLSVTSYGLPGPFISASVKKRNIFKRLGVLNIDGHVGIEGVAAASNPENLYTIEAGANVGVTFPQFFLPFSDETKLRLGLFDPKTQIRIGGTYTKRPEFERTILNGTNSYSWKTNTNKQFRFNLFDINLIRTPFISDDYQKRLDELDSLGNNLKNSFDDALVTSFSLTYIYNNNYYGLGHVGRYFSASIEPGGIFNDLWTSTKFVNRDSLQLYTFVRLQADYRQVTPKGRKGTLAFKAKAGIAIPFGDEDVLPYEKYFFGGGSTSVRAWKPRRLGPGSYNHIDESGEVSYQYEQQGEVLLETSIEYRQKIIGFLQGSAFLDAGNVWTLREETARPGAQFKFDKFIRQIALGGGFGLRFDFSFLLIRLDAALKLVDPARPLGSRFILENGFNSPPYDDKSRTEPFVIHFAIGYPF